MADVLPRDTALMIAVHLLRFEARRPDLLAQAEQFMDKYHFSPIDRATLSASIRSHNWLNLYLNEQGVPADLPEREAFVADLLRRTLARLIDIQADIKSAKFQTQQLRALAERMGDAPDAKKGG